MEQAVIGWRLTPRPEHRSWITLAYFLALGGLLLAIIPGVHKALLPPGLAANVGNNSESYLFALVLGAWIQFARPRLRHRQRWTWTIVVSMAWLLIGLGIAASSLPSRIRTMQEPSFALALLIPYVTLRRPLPSWIPSTVALATVLTMVIGVAVGAPPSDEALDFANWVISQAETLGYVILIPIALDLIDRGVLDPIAPTHAWARRAFYALLAMIPLSVVALGTSRRVGNGVIELTLNYVGRLHEAFIGVLILLVYFAVALGRRGRPVRAPTSETRLVSRRVDAR